MPEEGIIIKDCKCADCKFMKLPAKPDGFKIKVGFSEKVHNQSMIFCGAMNLSWVLNRVPSLNPNYHDYESKIEPYFYTDIQECEGYEPKRIKV